MTNPLHLNMSYRHVGNLVAKVTQKCVVLGADPIFHSNFCADKHVG